MNHVGLGILCGATLCLMDSVGGYIRLGELVQAPLKSSTTYWNTSSVELGT